MKLVMTMVVRDDADILDAQLAFHLHAGVDFIIAKDDGSHDGSADILESYAQEGYVLRLSGGDKAESDTVSRMARLAVSEHGADWIIASRPDEYWWPRGESLKDALVAVPERYTVVQALVRLFVPRPDDASFFAERMVVRRAAAANSNAAEPLGWALRPIVRAGSGVSARSGTDSVRSQGVPLRAWYPVEVLHFPARSAEQVEGRYGMLPPTAAPASSLEATLLEARDEIRLAGTYAQLVVEDAEVDQGVGEGSLVMDARLRDALRALRRSAGDHGASRHFALPSEAEGALTFTIPDIVDDAAYAVDCAAVGEVDLARLDRHIRELEARIAWLEDRFSARVMRTLSGLVHRSRS